MKRLICLLVAPALLLWSGLVTASPVKADPLPPTGAAKLTQGTGARCLTTSGGANGAAVMLGACASGSDWTFAAVSGGYTIQTGKHCLDGGADGSAGSLWACDGSSEQVWVLASQGDGSSIQNKRFSKCLQSDGLAPCATTAAQSWKVYTGTGAASATPSWTPCAAQDASCSFSGTRVVRYGASGTYATRTATGSILCSHLVFGDPLYGVVKTCDVQSAEVAPSWTPCAAQDASCSFSGTRVVRYGANGTYATRTATGSILCSHLVFGDPLYGVVKTCDVQAAEVAPTWTPCAVQDASCSFSGTRVVRYGASGTYATRTATGSILCSHLVFGDPLYGVVKTCDVQAAEVAPTWTPCAVQDASCSFSGTRVVRYGASGTYATRTATGSILCSHLVFGDPLYGVVKTCDVQSAEVAGTGTGGNAGGGGTSGGTGPAAGTPPGETPPNGTVFLINHQSGMCVSFAGGQQTAGQQSQQEICRGAAWNSWSFVNVGSGYQIKNLSTGACLYSDGGQTTSGAKIVQQPCNPATSGGRWQLRKTGEWFEIVGIQSERCLTATNGSRDDLAGLSQSDCTGADHQMFLIVAATFAPSAWTAPRTMEIVPVSAAPLPNGKLLMWGADGKTTFDSNSNTWTTLYDPATDRATVNNVTGVGQNFCPGTNILADGRILVDGGRNAGGTSFYDPTTNVWSAGPTVNIPRGYNANTTLSTGEAMTYGGSWSGDENSDKFGEVYSPSTGKWRLLSGVSGNAAAANTSRVPSVRDNHYWLFAAANGFAFNAGPSPQMFWIDTRGNGALQSVGTRGDDVWSQSGTATMYDIGRILKIGGAPNDNRQIANTNVYTIDITGGPGSTPTVTKLASDPFPRAFHNSVVLPDGDVVTIGGHTIATGFDDSKSVMIPTIWSPATGRFRLINPIGVPRNYHSWAVLMPDGRVASGGGGLCGCGADHPDFQFLTPPYLYDASGKLAARPTITSAPASAEAGSSLGVATDRAVASFALVRMSATTHTVNADQRRVPLAISSSSGTAYQLALPSERGILLPGPWMLFAIDSNGVPSVSKIVRIR